MKYESEENLKPIAILQGGREREGWSNTRGLSHLMCVKTPNTSKEDFSRNLQNNPFMLE
jgi:hypothetical protein